MNLDTKLIGEFDATVWADEFCRRFSVTRIADGEAMDEGLMLGWFANAIMAGYDHARKESLDD